MADYYCSSVLGSDAFSGATWALAKATLTGALAVATADGDRIYVDSAHSETPSANVALNLATAGISVVVMSVDRNGSVTTGDNGLLKGAKIAPASTFKIDIGSTQYGRTVFMGVIFETSSGASASNDIVIASLTGTTGPADLEFENCELNLLSTTSGAQLILGLAQGNALMPRIQIRNSSVKLPSNTTGSNGINLRNVDLLWTGTTIGFGGANKPLHCFTSSTGASGIRDGTYRFFDSDLSGYDASGGAYFNIANLEGAEIILRNCKLSSTPSLTTGSWALGSINSSITLINVDSGDTETVFEYRNRFGTLTETEAIYDDAGAQIDSTRVSWQVVTTSVCGKFTPFILPWCLLRSTSTASINVGFRIAHDSATDLNDTNLWPMVEYVSSATFPLGTLKSGRNARPYDGSAVDWTNNTDAWTGIGGFSNPNKQTVEVNFTPSEASTLRGRLNVGVASKTLYVCPKLRAA